ncbi:MAG: pyridoxal-dependent decarboxylase, partial [Candidatus Bipolaricaulota bacterium]
ARHAFQHRHQSSGRMSGAPMDDQRRPQMSSEEFRQWGKLLVDWIADYWEQVEAFPVRSRLRPGDVRAALQASPPEAGESFDTILRDVERVILPGLTHWQSPGFFAFFPANVSGPSVLGELLAAGLGVQGMLWATSPACTELETHVLDWLADMLGLPEGFRSSGAGGGVIQDSASSATLCAVLAARERAEGMACRDKGLKLPLVAYASKEAHSSVEKAAAIAGLGGERLHLVEVDERFAMRPEALAEAVKRDRRAGLHPFFVCATVGTTSSLAMDPVHEVGRLCAREGMWLHVDAAMAGVAALCPEHRYLHEGLELADSYCVNPHKWMLTNFDCDCFYVADREPLVGALTVLPEYLRNMPSESGQVIDYRDWQIPLGRRFRALKLWFVIRYFGVSGLRQLVRTHVELAREFAEWVDAHPRFELAAPVSLNLVCFRHVGGEEENRRLLTQINGSGRVYLTHTVLDGRFALRMCIGQARTQRSNVESAWELIRKAAGDL